METAIDKKWQYRNNGRAGSPSAPFFISALATALILAAGQAAFAGAIDSPAAPDSPASAMFTLDDLYNRLDAGEPGEKRTGPFVEPGADPAGTGRTVDEVMAVAPAAHTNAATEGDVLEDKAFWSLDDAEWGPGAGTMPVRTLSPDTSEVQTGYYASTDLTDVEPDLVSSNIRATVEIFGVPGDPNVVDTADATATAEDIVKGRTAYAAGEKLTGTLGSRQVGMITVHAGSTPPAGWLICDGAEVCRCCFPDLFQLIGTTYGPGDGVETFNLPNLQGRVVVGHDATDTDFNELGKTGGSKDNLLTTANMPAHDHSTFSFTSSAAGGHTHTVLDVQNTGAHTHNYSFPGQPAYWITDREHGDGNTGDPTGINSGTTSSDGNHTHTLSMSAAGAHGHTVADTTTGSSGGGEAHNIMQPYMALNFIIKY